MEAVTVRTIDGHEMEPEDALQLSKRMFFTGCFLLPWMWCVNVWYFWPEFRQPRNRTVKQYLDYSAAGALASGVVLLSWAMTFTLGGPRVLGEDLYHKLNIKDMDIDSWGIPF